MSFLKKKMPDLITSVITAFICTIFYILDLVPKDVWLFGVFISFILSVLPELFSKTKYGQKRKKTGIQSREDIENVKRKLRKIPYYNDYNGKLYKLFWGQTIKNNAFNYSSLFHIKRKDTQQFWDEALPEYKWLYYEAVIISLDDLENLHAFQNELQHAYVSFIKKNELKWQHDFWGKKHQNDPQMKRFQQQLEDSRVKLHKIWNPTNQKFYDQRTTEDILKDGENHSSQLSKNPPNELSEGLKELYAVLEDNYISDETRTEVLETIAQIEKQELDERQKEKREKAEMNARAVLDASKTYYHLS